MRVSMLRMSTAQILPPPPIRTVAACSSPLSANSSLSSAFSATLNQVVGALVKNADPEQNIQVHAVQVLMTPHFERLEVEYFPTTADEILEQRIDEAEAETAGRLLRANGAPDVPLDQAVGVPIFGAVVDQLVSRTLDKKLKSHYGVQTSIYYSLAPFNSPAPNPFCTPFYIPSKSTAERRSKRVGRWPNHSQDEADSKDARIQKNMDKWFNGRPGESRPSWFDNEQTNGQKSSLILPEELLFWQSEEWNPLKL